MPILQSMHLPATQIVIHTCTSKLITSLAKCRPPLNPVRRDFKALKNMDSFSLNGGYVPSYAKHPETDKSNFVPMENWQWYAEAKEGPSGGSVRQSGGGIGKLDAANEDGFFFKLNKSRLQKLKQLLKDKEGLKRKETPPSKKQE